MFGAGSPKAESNWSNGEIFGLGSIIHLLQLALACTFASIAGRVPDCDLMSEIALTGLG